MNWRWRSRRVCRASRSSCSPRTPRCLKHRPCRWWAWINWSANHFSSRIFGKPSKKPRLVEPTLPPSVCDDDGLNALRDCRRIFFPAKSLFYVEQPQTISVSFDRTQVAENLGAATGFPRLQSGRGNSGEPSVRRAPQTFRQGGRDAVATKILHPRHVSVSERRGLA